MVHWSIALGWRLGILTSSQSSVLTTMSSSQSMQISLYDVGQPLFYSGFLSLPICKLVWTRHALFAVQQQTLLV